MKRHLVDAGFVVRRPLAVAGRFDGRLLNLPPSSTFETDPVVRSRTCGIQLSQRLGPVDPSLFAMNPTRFDVPGVSTRTGGLNSFHKD